MSPGTLPTLLDSWAETLNGARKRRRAAAASPSVVAVRATNQDKAGLAPLGTAYLARGLWAN